MDITILEQFKKCPLCEKENEELITEVVAEGTERTLFHITCERCEGAFFVVVVENDMGLMSVGAATDVNATEAASLLDAQEISADTVLDVHNALKSQKIDVHALVQ